MLRAVVSNTYEKLLGPGASVSSAMLSRKKVTLAASLDVVTVQFTVPLTVSPSWIELVDETLVVELCVVVGAVVVVVVATDPSGVKGHVPAGKSAIASW